MNNKLEDKKQICFGFKKGFLNLNNVIDKPKIKPKLTILDKNMINSCSLCHKLYNKPIPIDKVPHQDDKLVILPCCKIAVCHDTHL